MHVELVNPLAYMYAKRKVGDGRYPLRIWGFHNWGLGYYARAYSKRFSNGFKVVQLANSGLLTFLLLVGRVLLSAFYGLP